MKKIHTHYDNLKVTRTAPAEVIRAAYKTLSQKYHPDKNQDNPDAIRIMSIINESYDVLSNPEKRKEHDLWIANKEFEENKPPASTTPNNSIENNNQFELKTFLNHFLRHWLLYSFCILILVSYISEPVKSVTKTPKYEREPPANVLETTTEAPTENANTSSLDLNIPFDDLRESNVLPQKSEKYVRPSTAPNNEPWPLLAGYVDGYPKLRTNGLSSLTVDNSKNDSDVFVKLVAINGADAFPVRYFYIPAYGSFTVKNISIGDYDIRYRDLDTGALSRSEKIELIERETFEGTEFSNVTLTLYKVRNGNMRTYQISESEF